MLIVLNALAFSSIFYVIHLVIVRFLPPEKIYIWPIMLYVASSVISILIYFPFFRYITIAAYYPLFAQLIILIGALILYTLIIGVYVLVVFGALLESAIRIRLLAVIANAGYKGITAAQILKTYNTDTIIRKRINRMLVSGIIAGSDKSYMIKKNSLPLYFNGYAVIILNRLYHKSWT
ncbi:hypothetical protein A2Z33_03985 [Candidatus Gottesmanbacteria bacterium RBG_16_52_11]|uniref:Uncharacterized protein n=1 Tax=Candidatus Gottesmanbacteria bacterium RBG_16_52_11 TaxID=1798374 RepID=A0A1F5YWK3_9BACT|nr:MAG: hypothetical protein A2Z33_03985 [Candidatus Gottesmanbacteria bacterium RBG_16_52_11]